MCLWTCRTLRLIPSVSSAESVLRPDFSLVSNGLREAASTIVRGNERVLTARLADAEFFLGVDRQSSVDRREALARVTFAEGLGERASPDRIERIATELVNHLDWLRGGDRRGPACCSSLQARSGQPDGGGIPRTAGADGRQISLGRRRNPRCCCGGGIPASPRGWRDALFRSDAGAIVALAERLELLLIIYTKGERPSGSSDPYALGGGNGLQAPILWDRGWRA